MGRSSRTMVLAAIGSAALVPLFGDPRSTPVTHPLWARLLLRALASPEVVRTSTQASEVFAALTWRDSLSLSAESYLRADRELVRPGSGRTLVATGPLAAEVTYAVPVVHAGEYQIRARMAGPDGSAAAAELVPLAGGPPAASLSFVAGASMQWSSGGTAHLDPGAYGARFLLPPGFSLGRIEIAPPCVNPIEPPAGWQPSATTMSDDLAVTTLQAVEGEHELAPAAGPIELRGADFADEAGARSDSGTALGVSAFALRAGPKGRRGAAVFVIPEDGIYVLSALVRPGAGQRWLLDRCRSAVVCPGDGLRWRPVLAQRLAPGLHTIELSLGADGALELVRIEAKKRAPSDYAAALRRLGFDPGPPGPVSRATALDAARFVREKRALASCAHPVVIEETPPLAPSGVRLEERAAESAPAPGRPAPPAEPVEPPLGPPLLPPQEPASPTRPASG